MAQLNLFNDGGIKGDSKGIKYFIAAKIFSPVLYVFMVRIFFSIILMDYPP